MQIINIKESDYNFSVTITSEIDSNLELKDIPCNVVLPKETTGEIILQFFVTKEEYKQSGINKVWKLSVNGERNKSGLTYQKIIVDEIIPLKTKQIHDNLFVITGEPRKLYIENHWSFVSEPRNPIVEFQVTPSRFLKPTRSMPDAGKYLWQLSIELSDGNIIVFDDEEYEYKDEKGNLITAHSLIAHCESLESGDQETVQKVSDLLDDVLLITSFAEGQRCLSLGWKTHDHQMQRMYFRRDKTIPPPLEDFWSNKLIEREDLFNEFLQIAYKNFCFSEFQPNIRRAINSLLIKRETAESQFMSLYAGLESLILGFRKVQGIEFVFPDADKWKDFEIDLKRWVKKESTLKDDKEIRCLIYENIKGLQRRSFGSVFKEMLKFYKIENALDDLWNITGDKDGWSISKIRNKIVHGDTFIEPTKYKHLQIAMYNLRWVLSRLVFTVLGWDIEKSDVSGTKLTVVSAYNWMESRKYLSADNR